MICCEENTAGYDAGNANNADDSLSESFAFKQPPQCRKGKKANAGA